MLKSRISCTLVLLILVGCTPVPGPSPTVRESPFVEPTEEPTRRNQPADLPEEEPTIESVATEPQDPDARIRIVTSSDWTEFRLIDGVILDDVQILSSSADASVADYDKGRFALMQSINQAERGDTVELVADLYFRDGYLSEIPEFEIDRGHIGETFVEVSSYACGESAPVETFTWEGINPKGDNAQRFTMPATQLTLAPQDEYTVIAQLNFWYYGPGEHGGFEWSSGERMTPLTPLLGETYRASDPAVVYQQIEWASDYGVDAFSIEWTTPRGIGCCGSMEDTLDDVFLKSRNIHKVDWVIFYDFVLRLNQTAGLEQFVGSLDFNNPEVYETFVSDFKHFAQKYFGHPQYLTIDQRPVIYIWATNAYVGDLEGAIREAREEVSKLGYDVFIVGDEVMANYFDPHHASLFDGNSTFTFLIPGLNPTSWTDVGDASAAVDQTFKRWRENMKDLKVINRDEYVNFQPAWAPQYDDRLFALDHPTYVPANSKDQVIVMAEVAREHAQPAGSDGQKLVWLNTWNNWAETTTVEPTANLGPKYPAGNYQFEMLEAVREVFGPATSYCEVP